ncbi:DoxX family protein [Gaoshiqia sp. Z1-71]|uniref:DoxX family protein n=1 Tax=Gaoshiqia hydrogeniformans TaxID=3290090 RepID=UPI003BF864CA
MGKKMLGSKTNEFVESLWLMILRVGSGAFMLTHGIPKIQLLLGGGEIAFADPFGLGPTISLILAVFAEVICSVLLILGVVTRLASVPLIVTMSVAAFYVHANDPFAGKEMALLYLLIFITILVYGSGRFALGRLIKGN